MKKREILKKAVKIINASEEERRYNITCVRAGICPECGNNLTKKPKYGYNKMYRCSCGFSFPDNSLVW